MKGNPEMEKIMMDLGVSVGGHKLPAKIYNSIWEKIDALREENNRLLEWRVNATAALQNEGGARYEDVPNLIKALRKERTDWETRFTNINTQHDALLNQVEGLQFAAESAGAQRDTAQFRLEEARELCDQETCKVEHLRQELAVFQRTIADSDQAEPDSEAPELRKEVERLQAVDTDRERHLALYKEKVVEIEEQFNVMASERDRFNASVNRIAEIVGLSGKQCYAPDAVEREAKALAIQAEEIEKHLSTVTETREAYQGCIERISEILGLGTESCVPNAVERKAKLIAEEYGKSLAYAEFMNTQTKELNEQIEALETELHRLKKAAIECDFHVLKCPILAGEDLILLDPEYSIIEIAPGTDFGEGIVDEKGSVHKMGADGIVKEIPKPEDHVVQNPGLNLDPVDE